MWNHFQSVHLNPQTGLHGLLSLLFNKGRYYIYLVIINMNSDSEISNNKRASNRRACEGVRWDVCIEFGHINKSCSNNQPEVWCYRPNISGLLNILSVLPEMSPGPARCKAELPDQCSLGKMQTQCSAPQRGGSKAMWILQVSWKSKN